MAANLPTSSPQQTYSAKFAKVYLNGIRVAGATDIEYGMNYDGTWEQTVGDDRPTNNPDKRYGSGTIQQLRWNGASLVEICEQAGITTAQQDATGDADLRYITFTMTVPYTDGNKTTTDTLFDVYIRKQSRRWEGNRLAMDSVTFEYAAQGQG